MRLILVMALALLSTGIQAQEAAKTAGEVLDCARANAPDKTFKHQVNFVTTNIEGIERSLETRIYGERAKEGLRLNLRVTAPPATADTTILVREREGQDDMRIFLPAAQKTQQVTGSMAATKLLGTDFSYQDLKQMFGAMLDGEAVYDSVAEVAGRATYRLKLVPAAEEAAPYDVVFVDFDQQTCVPLQAEFKADDGQLLRRLFADTESLTTESSHHYARLYTLEDLISETKTRAEFSEVAYDGKLPRKVFHPLSFKDPE